ncbi:MAG: Ig-like domain-containing protein, partial [Clostridia bacterium]|nr:Ig-like domain-containing protein [Clostridia bacterium]
TIADVEVLMTNKVIPIEDEKKGKEGDVFDLYTELIKNNKEYEDITITWESSDDSVASVDANGKVTLKKPGTATITAKSGDTVLGTFVLGAEAQAPTTDDAPPYTGDTDTPQTGDYAVGWTIALSAILLASGATAKISYDAIKRRRNARAK